MLATITLATTKSAFGVLVGGCPSGSTGGSGSAVRGTVQTVPQNQAHPIESMLVSPKGLTRYSKLFGFTS